MVLVMKTNQKNQKIEGKELESCWQTHLLAMLDSVLRAWVDLTAHEVYDGGTHEPLF